MVAMVVMQHAIYRELDCFDLPTHWAKNRYMYINFLKFIRTTFESSMYYLEHT